MATSGELAWTGTVRAELLLHERLDGRGIDVADDNHGQPPGPIPCIIKRDELLTRELANRVIEPADSAPGGSGARPQEMEIHLGDAGRGRVARRELAENHAAFALDQLGVEGDLAGKFTERAEALAQRGLLRIGKLEVINRVVEKGERSHVGAGADAEPLEGLEERAAGVRFRAAKHHVLDEVREAALIVVLVQ
jgi:hypothetical protein